MKDICNRKDLELLMKLFYQRLLNDNSINYLFTEVAKIDLHTHLPHIVNFWEQSLFNSAVYKNNVMQIHLDLNIKEKLTPHFESWLKHFNNIVDEHFEGLNADKIKTRALSIATIMKIKMQWISKKFELLVNITL